MKDHYHGEDTKRCERKGNSHQTFQGSAAASPCLLTDTAKHGPAEKVGCPSGTVDGSESQKEGCTNAFTWATPPKTACQPSPSAGALYAFGEHISTSIKEEKRGLSYCYYNADLMIGASVTIIKYGATK